MKKIIPFLLGLLFGVLPLQAAEKSEQDTTVHFNNKVILLQDSVGQLKVKVFDNDSIPYKQLYEGIFSDGKSYEKWTVMEAIGIQLPFMTKKAGNYRRNYSMEPHWAGIGWGFANISDQNFNLNNIQGVSLKSELSTEFFVNLFQKILPIYRNNLGLTSGLGFNWHNYQLDMNKHLVDANGITTLEHAPAGISYEFSRLRTFNLTVPLLLEWQPTFGKNRNFFISAGLIGGVNTFASYKVKYIDASGRKISTTEGRGMNVTPLTLDYFAQIGYESWAIYAKYSPFSIFQSAKGPNIRAVSLGAKLNF